MFVANITEENKYSSMLDKRNNRYYLAWQKGYERFLRIRGKPREIALGLALGLFVAMSPTMGFQMIIAIFFATLFKWNKIAAAIAVWLSNPLTAPFIYSLTYFIGARLLGTASLRALPKELSFSTIYALLQKAPEIILAMTIGGVILGIPLAIFGYYFSYTAVQKYQKDIKVKIKTIQTKIMVYFKAELFLSAFMILTPPYTCVNAVLSPNLNSNYIEYHTI